MEVIIDEIGGAYLIDLMPYWITVVASDNWGNVDHWNVTWVQASSIQNTVGVDPPPRVENLQAWDHPEDDGTAIDVQWSPSAVDDFAFYVVWASEHPVENVAIKWMECEENPSECGLLVIHQQRQSWNGPMNIMLEKASYGGNSLSEATASDIIPNNPIWVTVTIHDIKGNAFLTNLGEHMTLVTPIDNSGDIIAPDRLPEPDVEDRPGDSGNGLLVTFSTSDASDLDHYEVYADTIPFTDVGTREPAMTVDRDGNAGFSWQDGFGGPGGGRQATEMISVELTSLSNNMGIDPGVMIWVAVVPVDSSDNAWLTDLNVGQAAAVDDSLLDPGLHLPEITGVQGSWNEDGTGIVVTWADSPDAQVRGYIVHLSSEVYEDVRYAEHQLEMVQGTHLTIKASDFDPELDANGTWYVSVVATDGEVTRFGVSPVTVEEWDPNNPNAGVEIDEEGSSEWWNELNPMQVALMTVLTLMIVLLSMIILGRLRKARYDPLEHATPNWELQVDDWGGDNYATTIEPQVDLEGTLVPAATAIRETTLPPSRTTPPPSSVDDLESLADDLLDDAKKEDPMDFSFLDDLL